MCAWLSEGSCAGSLYDSKRDVQHAFVFDVSKHKTILSVTSTRSATPRRLTHKAETVDTA